MGMRQAVQMDDSRDKKAEVRWRIRLMGKLAVLDGASVCLDKFERRIGARILAYVALYPERVIYRSTLAEEFWPEPDETPPLVSLRNDLSILRRQLRDKNPELQDLLLRDKSVIRLNVAIATTDFREWKNKLPDLRGVPISIAQADALSILVEEGEAAGSLLTGLGDDWWLQSPRHDFDREQQQALVNLAKWRAGAGDLSSARELVRRAIARDADETLTTQATDFERQIRPGAVPRVTNAISPAAKSAAAAKRLEDLSPTFPPLPPVFNRFVGRDDELASVLQHLRDTLSSNGIEAAGPPRLRDAKRLLTVTGTAGVGKTRFAQEILRRARQAKDPPRVVFVPLVAVRAAGDIPGAIASALGVIPESPDGLIAQLGRVMRLQPTVAALDNLEHLVAGGRLAIESLARALLESAPSLVLLATSRERLGADFEQEVRLPTLAVPGMDAGDAKDSRFSLELLLQVNSVQLFEEQARRADPDFRVSARNAASVAALCRRLDGLPLALEIVAARAKTKTPGEILKSLDERTALDQSRPDGTRPADYRHRTLRDAVEWSHSLLPKTTRAFFNALSVFRGGFTLASAAAVCGDGDVSEATVPLELLQDRHFIRSEDDETTGAKRFRLLETMREFGRDQLTAEEHASLARRHADFFLAFAEEAKRHITGRYTADWLNRQETEHANLAAAIDLLEREESWSKTLRMVDALSHFWRMRGYGLQWSDRVARLVLAAENSLSGEFSDLPKDAKWRSYLAAGANAAVRLYLGINKFMAARPLCEKALAYATAADDFAEMASAFRYLGYIELTLDDDEASKNHFETVLQMQRMDTVHAQAMHSLGSMMITHGDIAAGCEMYKDSLLVSRRLEHWHQIAITLVALGNVAIYLEPFEQSVIYVREGLSVYEYLNDRAGIGIANSVLSNLYLYSGDLTQARAFATIALNAADSRGDILASALATRTLGFIALKEMELNLAYRHFKRTLNQTIEGGAANQMVPSVNHVACVAAAAELWADAARLWGGVDAKFMSQGILNSIERRQSQEYIDQTRATLGAAAFEAAYAEGQALPWEAAIELARNLPIDPATEK